MILGKYGSGVDHVTIKKIDNGFVIEACCSDEQKSEYIKTISKVPAILKRWFREDGKRSAKEYEEMDREETSEKTEDGKVKVKIKMTPK